MNEPMTSSTRITVVDIDMPFGSMVRFMIKLAFAAIPAYLIILFIVFLVIALTGGAAALLGNLVG